MTLKSIHHNLLIIPLFVVSSALFSCTNGNDFAKVVAKDSKLKIFVDSLQTSNRTYKSCIECKLSYLEGTKITGFSNRMPPKMLYHQREIELGNFEYDTYSIMADKNSMQSTGKIFFSYFSPKQKALFAEFFPFYLNKINHYKQVAKVIYVNNTAIITIENREF